MWMESGKQGRKNETNNFVTVHLLLSLASSSIIQLGDESGLWGQDVIDICFLKCLVAGMLAPLFAGTLYISYPKKTHGIHVFCERCSTEVGAGGDWWKVKIFGAAETKHL